MFSRIAALCLACLVTLVGPLAIAAQDRPAVGAAVPYIGNDGVEIGQITVVDFIDPFQEYDSSSPPSRGYHFALITVTVANTGSRPLPVDPGAFYLVDSDGYNSRAAYLYRGDAPAVPDLQFTEVAPGDSITGALGFQILNGVVAERIVYVPANDRQVTVVDQREALVSFGTAVPLIGTDGVESHRVTVRRMADPFEAYDPSSPPQRGNHFVLIEVIVENTGSRPMNLNPGAFYLVDTLGFAVYPTGVFRPTQDPPDLQYAEVAPGASVTGVIGFQVLNGVEIAEVGYAPSFDVWRVVVDVAAGGAEPAPLPTVAAEPTATGGDSSSAECVGVTAWATGTVERISLLQPIVQPFTDLQDGGNLDVAVVEQAAADLQALADEQRASGPPPAAEPLNVLIADVFQNFADALTEMAGAINDNDAVGIMSAAQKFQDASAVFDPGGEADQLLGELTAACPEVQSVLGG